MEKPQVTFAVQASRLTGSVGHPIFIASAVLDVSPRQILLLRGSFGQVSEQYRVELPNVPLNGHDQEIVMAHAYAEFASALSCTYGLQLDFDVQNP